MSYAEKIEQLKMERRSIAAFAESLAKTQQELKAEVESLKAKLRNTEHELAAYRDKIDKDELVRCLRAARDSYRSETYTLKDRVSELEQDNDQLRDDNMNLSAMTRSAYAKLFAPERAEVAA